MVGCGIFKTPTQDGFQKSYHDEVNDESVHLKKVD